VESDQSKVPSTSSVYEEILRIERCLSESFERDVSIELELVDRAVVLLTTALSSVEPVNTARADEIAMPRSGGVRNIMLFALQGIGALALHVIRAARASLATGYEAESLGNDRILVEFTAHRKALLEDETGKEARAWLEAETGRGIGKRVSKIAPEGLFSFLSRFAHADARPLGHMANYDARTLRLAPMRTGITNTSLVLHAMFATDQAAMIATLAGFELPGHSDLMNAIVARRNELQRDGELT
jgi:hypothetical protein